MRYASFATYGGISLLVLLGLNLGEQPTPGHSLDLTSATERAPAATQPYSIEDLAKLVREVNQGDALIGRTQKILNRHAPVTTLEDFLPLLPEHLRQNPVLVKSSRSAQSGTPDRPRVLLSTPDSTFIASFSGDGLGSNSRLEVIQFHAKATPAEKKRGLKDARFEYAEVDFEAGKSPRLIRNSQACAGCHGSNEDLRPNFDSFSEWTGLYGEHGEKIAKNSAEEKQLKSFIANAKTHPRYRALFDLEKTHLARNADGTMAGRANSTMNQNLNRLNAKRIARLVKTNTPDYAKTKYSILASLYCANGTAKDFVSRFFPNRAEDTPEAFTTIEEDSTSSQPAAFFWAVRPRNSSMFFWTLTFGDMMNTSAVRTKESATLDYALALIAGDAELKALPRTTVKLKTGTATLPSCESLEKAAAQTM